MSESWLEIKTSSGCLIFDPEIGNIRGLQFTYGRRKLDPLNSAPWVDDQASYNDLCPVERNLSGDFFCAPFGKSDIEEFPTHGWSANSRWSELSHHADQIRLGLDAMIMGAKLTKVLRLSAEAPLLYQENFIEGGTGGLTVAFHPMVHVQSHAVASFSPKKVALTQKNALDHKRNKLACSALSSDLRTFPAADGSNVDLTQLPIADNHEDFVTLIESDESKLGWTAIVRETEDDIVFVLKNPSTLPITMLWHSNGGRDNPPWNGRHTRVIGIEDGCAAGSDGHSAALKENAISAFGVPTCLTLSEGKTHRIAQVIGSVSRPSGWREIENITVEQSELIITNTDGRQLKIPYERNFLETHD